MILDTLAFFGGEVAGVIVHQLIRCGVICQPASLLGGELPDRLA
jgi:hypothetical protein